MLLIGFQGTGKSKLLDTMSCGLWLDNPRYPPTPEGWTSAIKVILRARPRLAAGAGGNRHRLVDNRKP